MDIQRLFETPLSLGGSGVSKHPIHPVVRVAIWLLRWPLTLYPTLFALVGIDQTHYAAPLQKQFYYPVFAMLWAILSLLPFILIRRRIPYLVYCAAFCVIGGWMVYDLVVPFRYVAPNFLGEISDPGGSYTFSGSTSMGYNYWITRFVPSSFESWLFLTLLVWPFLLGSVYHFLYGRGRRNAS